MQNFRLTHDKTGRIIGNDIISANTPLLRLVGLLGKKELPAGAGVWLQPSRGVHTFGMRFAIDVLGLDAHLRVVRLWPNLAPHKMTAIDLRVTSVVELARGTIDAHQILVDDQVTLVREHNKTRRLTDVISDPS